MTRSRIVVVGAGPAGMRCAERIAQRGGDGFAVTLLGAEAALPYNRVALSQYLAGDMAEDALVTHDAATLAGLGIDWRAGVEMRHILPDLRQIELLDHATGQTSRLPYDRLVLALGAQAIRLPLPGAELPGVLLYRTLDDVRTMLETAARGGRAVVIGGGLLGLEAASGLARRGMQLRVVHGAGRLMERQIDDGAARLLAARLRTQSIRTELGASTVAITGHGRADGVQLSDGRHLPAELVVMAVGIRPRAMLAKSAGLVVQRGIVVDDRMRSSDAAILAIGECAEHAGQCCGLVAPALAQAEVAARVVLGEAAQFATLATQATVLKVAGAGMWSAGDPDARDAEAIIYDDTSEGVYRKLLLRQDRLVGAMLFGETGDAGWYFDLITQARPLGALRPYLAFGPGFAAATGAAA